MFIRKIRTILPVMANKEHRDPKSCILYMCDVHCIPTQRIVSGPCSGLHSFKKHLKETENCIDWQEHFIETIHVKLNICIYLGYMS